MGVILAPISCSTCRYWSLAKVPILNPPSAQRAYYYLSHEIGHIYQLRKLLGDWSSIFLNGSAGEGIGQFDFHPGHAIEGLYRLYVIRHAVGGQLVILKVSYIVLKGLLVDL